VRALASVKGGEPVPFGWGRVSGGKRNTGTLFEAKKKARLSRPVEREERALCFGYPGRETSGIT